MSEPYSDTGGAPNDPPLDRPTACVKCRYELLGLRTSGTCPECGTPIYDSVHTFFLRFAGPEYVRTIERGLSLLLNGILLYIVFAVGVGVVAATLSYRTGVGVQVLLQFLMLVPTGMVMLGYWRYTERDEAVMGLESPTTARALCRAATACYAGLTASSLLALTIVMLLQDGTEGLMKVIVVLMAVIALAGAMAGIVMVLASLSYTAWMAARLPDTAMQAKARRYMWLLPLISILGLMLVYIGPLIALVMYWNLLDRLRKKLRGLKSEVPGFPRPA